MQKQTNTRLFIRRQIALQNKQTKAEVMDIVVVSLLLLFCASGCLSLSSGPPIGNPIYFQSICVQLWPEGHGPITSKLQTLAIFAASLNSVTHNLQINRQAVEDM